jgi:hypothetical protein
MKSLFAKLALYLAGDNVKKALILIGAIAIAYKTNYPATELSKAIGEYVLPGLGLLGISSGGLTSTQPPAVQAALQAAAPPAGTVMAAQAPDIGGAG